MIVNINDFLTGLYKLDQNTSSSTIDAVEEDILIYLFGPDFTNNLLTNYTNPNAYRYYILAQGHRTSVPLRKILVPSVFAYIYNSGIVNDSSLGTQVISKSKSAEPGVLLQAMLFSNSMWKYVKRFIEKRGLVDKLRFDLTINTPTQIVLSNPSTGFNDDLNFIQVGEVIYIGSNQHTIQTIVSSTPTQRVVNISTPATTGQRYAYMDPYNSNIMKSEIPNNIWEI